MIFTLPIVALCCTANNKESNQLTKAGDDKSSEEKSTAENTGHGSIFRRVVFKAIVISFIYTLVYIEQAGRLL